MSVCWRCNGAGVEILVWDAIAADGKRTPTEHRLRCLECEGEGDAEYARLLRARRQGWRECEEALHEASVGIPQPIDAHEFQMLVSRDEEHERLEFLRQQLKQATILKRRFERSIDSTERELNPGLDERPEKR